MLLAGIDTAFPFQNLNQSLPSFEYLNSGAIPAPTYSQDIETALVPTLDIVTQSIVVGPTLIFLTVIVFDPDTLWSTLE